MKKKAIDLSKGGEIYPKSSMYLDDDMEGRCITFRIIISLMDLLNLKGIEGLNDYVDDVCIGFGLSGLTYKVVGASTDTIEIRVMGEVFGLVSEYDKPKPLTKRQGRVKV